jgi:hypothetical protein
MAFVPDRYVIKKDDGTYFTEMRSTGFHDVLYRGAVVARVETLEPKFEAPLPRFASQFDTEADALLILNDPQYGAPETFKGCSVVISE